MNAWLRLLRFRLLNREEPVVLRDGRSLGLLSRLAALIALGALFSLIMTVIRSEDVELLPSPFHDAGVPATRGIAGLGVDDTVVSVGPPMDPEGWWTGEDLTAQVDSHPLLQQGMRHDNVSAFAGIVRQVDAALLQALSRSGLTTDAVEQAESEVRVAPDGQTFYPFVRLVIKPDLALFESFTPACQKAETAAFAAIMRDSLKIWAPKARLRKEGDRLYFITVDNLVTHCLCYGEDGVEERIVREPDDGRPVLTIIIDDMGESLTAARKLLDLPYPVTLSVWPHGTYAGYTATLARERGRQVFIHHPLEPLRSERRRDIERTTLKASATGEEIAASLHTALAAVPYAVGLNNHMGSKFTTSRGAVEAYFLELKRQRPDLIVLDSLTHEGSVFYDEALRQGFTAHRRSLFLDDDKDSRAEILKELDRALVLARKHGNVIAIGHPRAGTLAALAAWKGYAAKDVRIAPLAPPTINRGVTPQDSEQP